MDILPPAPTLAAFIAASVLLTLTPGPDMTLFLARTLSRGRAAGFAAMLGACAGLVLHTALAALGLSALLAASPHAFLAVKVAGAAYLGWLALDAVRNGSALRLDAGAPSGGTLPESFLAGLGINLLNPKIVMFFVTFLPQFVRADDPMASARLAVLGGVFILVALPICAGLILAAERFTSALRASPRALRVFDWLFAGLMGAFAARIVLARGAQ